MLQLLQSRLSRTASDPFRLIRPRPIGCDRGIQQPVKIFLRLLPFFGIKAQKKCLSDPLSCDHLYTPKEADSRIFVTGGLFFARKKWPNFLDFLA